MDFYFSRNAVKSNNTFYSRIYYIYIQRKTRRRRRSDVVIRARNDKEDSNFRADFIGLIYEYPRLIIPRAFTRDARKIVVYEKDVFIYIGTRSYRLVASFSSSICFSDAAVCWKYAFTGKGNFRRWSFIHFFFVPSINIESKFQYSLTASKKKSISRDR